MIYGSSLFSFLSKCRSSNFSNYDNHLLSYRRKYIAHIFCAILDSDIHIFNIVFISSLFTVTSLLDKHFHNYEQYIILQFSSTTKTNSWKKQIMQVISLLDLYYQHITSIPFRLLFIRHKKVFQTRPLKGSFRLNGKHF